MIDQDDFSIDAEPAVAGGAPNAAAAPRVVIVYRNRGVPSSLIPPTLILLAALLILSHQRRTPIQVFAPSALTVAAAAPAPAAPVAPAQPIPDSEAKGPPAPEKDREATPKPRPEEAPRPTDFAARPHDLPALPDPVPAVSPDPPAKPKNRTAIASNLTPDPQPAPPPPVVTKEKALEDIRREAERKEAEIRRLEALKPRIRGIELAELTRKAEAKRPTFHEALREALAKQAPGTKIADEIESLCNTFGRSIPDDVRQKINRRLKTSHARLGRGEKVEAMRNWGLPEPMILDFLAHDVHRNMGSRGGPRTEDEVLMWAARMLLTMPPRGAQSHPPRADNAPPPDPSTRLRPR